MVEQVEVNETQKGEDGNGHQSGDVNLQLMEPVVAAALAEVEVAKTVLSDQLEQVRKAREELAELLQEAETVSTNVNEALAELQTANTAASQELTKVKALAAEVQKTRDDATASGAQTSKLLEQARQDRDKTSQLAAVADTTEERIAGYEQNLGSLQEQMESLQARIEGLLPGATSAGLAQSFQQRKDTFKRPKIVWSSLFGSAVGLLLIVAAVGESGLLNVSSSGSLSAIGIGLLHRLPFAVPLVWFAIFAQRRYAEAARLEEDYAYKEAVSRAFEGYKRELQGISDLKGQHVPLIQFCSDVLRTLSMMPGRVFDAKLDEPTPLSAAASLAEKAKISGTE